MRNMDSSVELIEYCSWNIASLNFGAVLDVWWLCSITSTETAAENKPQGCGVCVCRIVKHGEHSESPLLNLPPYKSKICRRYLDGSCYFGPRCHFAHGPADLQNRPWSVDVSQLVGSHGHWPVQDWMIVILARLVQTVYWKSWCFGNKACWVNTCCCGSWSTYVLQHWCWRQKSSCRAVGHSLESIIAVAQTLTRTITKFNDCNQVYRFLPCFFAGWPVSLQVSTILVALILLSKSVCVTV